MQKHKWKIDLDVSSRTRKCTACGRVLIGDQFLDDGCPVTSGKTLLYKDPAFLALTNKRDRIKYSMTLDIPSPAKPFIVSGRLHYPVHILNDLPILHGTVRELLALWTNSDFVTSANYPDTFDRQSYEVGHDAYYRYIDGENQALYDKNGGKGRWTSRQRL